MARLTGAGFISEVGDWLLLIGLPLFVLKLTGSAVVTASVFILELIPTMFVSTFAGVLVDRFDRWRVLTFAAFAQAVVITGLLAVESQKDLWIVYLVVVIQSSLSTVIAPARLAAAPALVPAGELIGLNGLIGMAQGAARLIGAPLGGLLLSIGGLDWVALADAVTFLIAAALFAPGARTPAQPAAGAPGAHEHDGVWKEWTDGMKVVRSTPDLRRMMGVGALLALTQGGFVILFLLFVTDRIGGNETEVGILRGVAAIGTVGAGLFIGSILKRLDPTRLLTLSLTLGGVISLVIWNASFLTTHFGVYIVLFILMGVPGLGAMAGVTTLLQRYAEDAVRGRVMSTYFAVYGAMQALGMLLGGFFESGNALIIALEVQGLLYLAAAAVTLRLTRVREPLEANP